MAALWSCSRYSFRRSLTVGCPGALVFESDRAPKVRYPPNFGARIREGSPFSPIASAITGPAHQDNMQDQVLSRGTVKCRVEWWPWLPNNFPRGKVSNRH